MNIRILTIIAALALFGAACGDATAPAPPIQAPPGATNPAATSVPTTTADPPPTTAPAPTTTAPPFGSPPATTVVTLPPTTTPPTTADPPPTTSVPGLAGEPWDHGPEAGAALGVVAVAHDDVLNVRAGPGVGERIVATLNPTATGIVATGAARLLTGHSLWFEIDAGATTGWAAAAYLSRQGHTYDSTAEIIALLGERPVAGTMAELGQVIASAIAPFDPSSRIVVVVAAWGEHDLGEIVLDVTGYGDDSVSGSRLHVFGQPTDDRSGFSLKSVEETPFCFRGVTPEGLCA